jgi:hypothetical protein
LFVSDFHVEEIYVIEEARSRRGRSSELPRSKTVEILCKTPSPENLVTPRTARYEALLRLFPGLTGDECGEHEGYYSTQKKSQADPHQGVSALAHKCAGRLIRFARLE